jgi:type IV pilus assembly protein PilV
MAHAMKRPAIMRVPGKAQRGAMLLEAMIGILIFSIGILAMIAMQGLAVGYVSDAKYRSDAAFFANELIGLIWIDRANLANYAYPGGTAPALTSWATRVQTGLPAGTAAVTADATTGTVTVQIGWTTPNTTAAHSYQSIALIVNP